MIINKVSIQTMFFLFLFVGNIWAPPGFRNPWMQLSRFNRTLTQKVPDVVKQPLPDLVQKSPIASWEEAILPEPGDDIVVVIDEFRDGEIWEVSSHLRLGYALNDLNDYIVKRKRAVKKPAVIFDVDETLFAIRLLGNIANGEKTQQWLLRVDSILNFYKKLQEEGDIVCFFLTARKARAYEVTKSMLNAVGYSGGELICLPGEDLPVAVDTWKESVRIDLAERRGFTILATLDDQMPNLRGRCVGVGVKIPEITKDLLASGFPFMTRFLVE